MKKNNQKPGQNLIEAIFAIAIFIVLIVGSATITLRYISNITRTQELLLVKNILQESNSAFENLAINNWSAIANGTYGLTNTNGYWELIDDPDIINNKFTRSITISEVQRDINCSLVESGGSTDPDTKKVDFTINWDTTYGEQEKTLTQNFTAWPMPTICLAEIEPPGPGGQAGSLGLNVETATRQEYLQWFNLLVTINGVQITNESSEAVVVDKVQVFMDEPSMDIYGFYFNNSKRWGWFGPGSPNGAQPSGTVLNISNYSIAPGQTVTIKMTFFTGSSGEITFSINLIMEDATEIETDEFTL